MYVKRNIGWNIIMRFAWKNLIFFTAWSSLIVYVQHHLSHHDQSLSIPFLPLSTIGIAVAFYIGFKNNAAYDRFWEARKIWGGIVNNSRTWANQVLSFVTPRHATSDTSAVELDEDKRILIYRHLAWINALRIQLRQLSSFSPNRAKSVKMLMISSPERIHWDEEVGKFLNTDEYLKMITYKNTATQILRSQGEHLKELMEVKGLIEDFRHMEMMRILEELYNLQGMCERIKSTPFPRQYAYFSKVFTWIFILLLPFGLIGEFTNLGHSFMILTVPFSVLISWIFLTMEIVGDNSEDPFENFINDVPMTAICNTIEIDLREMLGETNLPEKVTAQNDILM